MLLSILLALVLPLSAADEQADHQVLIVVTNHATLGDTGKPTGYWLAEVAHPWVRLRDAGIAVDIASPQGGFAPMDPRSFDLDDADNRRFWETLAAVEAVMATKDLRQLEPADYAAVYFAGGHGTMWDFPGNPAIRRFVQEMWQEGGIVAAVCHGPAALVDVPLADGGQLVDGKRLTAFSVSEEKAVELQEAVPFLLTERLAEQGAEVLTAEDFQKKVVVDGRLITGQNPASAAAAGAAIVEQLRPSGD